jgi:hypothetical protein
MDCVVGAAEGVAGIVRANNAEHLVAGGRGSPAIFVRVFSCFSGKNEEFPRWARKLVQKSGGTADGD